MTGLLFTLWIAAAPLQFTDADIKFVDAPGMPHGTQLAVLEGAPKAAGLFTIRLRVSPKFKLPRHTHPKDERVTVLEGSINVQLDGAKAPKKFSAGSFYLTPAGVPHHLWSDEGATLQMTGEGPWVVDVLPSGDAGT